MRINDLPIFLIEEIILNLDPRSYYKVSLLNKEYQKIILRLLSSYFQNQRIKITFHWEKDLALPEYFQFEEYDPRTKQLQFNPIIKYPLSYSSHVSNPKPYIEKLGLIVGDLDYILSLSKPLTFKTKKAGIYKSVSKDHYFEISYQIKSNNAIGILEDELISLPEETFYFIEMKTSLKLLGFLELKQIRYPKSKDKNFILSSIRDTWKWIKNGI